LIALLFHEINLFRTKSDNNRKEKNVLPPFVPVCTSAHDFTRVYTLANLTKRSDLIIFRFFTHQVLLVYRTLKCENIQNVRITLNTY
jgi:hypothetical protein